MNRSPAALPDASKPEQPLMRIGVEGEATPRTVTIRSTSEVVVGRDAKAMVRLAHDAVSRRHLRLFERGGSWFAEDLGSRHGTVVDGVLLAPRQPVLIGPTATILVRPFALRVNFDGSTSMSASLQDSFASSSVLSPGALLTPHRAAATNPAGAPPAPVAVDNRHESESSIRSLDASTLNELNGRRLALLLEAAEAIHAARDERGIAEAATSALLTGTGFARALALRWSGDVEQLESLETLAVSTAPDGLAVPEARVSRTLLRAAAKGVPVILEDHAPLREAESIIGAGVAAALCAPVVVPPLVEAFLYLDSQRRSARPTPDAATFCHLIAKLCGLAIANLRRMAVEQRHRELERQLVAARRAQQRLLPPEAGETNGCRWRLYSRPGLVVAGDVAGVHSRGGLSTFFVGDVRGKGVDAAIVMTMVATHLSALLEKDRSLEEIARDVSLFIHRHRRDESDFASLFIAQIDRDAKRLRTVDAGHGLAVRFGGGRVSPIESEGGPMLGITGQAVYGVSEFPLDGCDRILLYTDGVNEQHDAEGGMLGIESVLRSVGGAETADAVVERLQAALRAHAGGDVFADDVTILAVDLRCG